VTRTPGGARLRVHHRAGDDRWADLAAAYWDGRMPGLDRVKSSRFAVVHAGPVPPDGRACFFKRFLLRGAADWLKHWVRPSRARRALVSGERIRRLGFVAPVPLCLIEERRCGPGQTALVTEAIEGARSVRDRVLEPLPAGAGALARRRCLLHAVGGAIGAWHAAGLYHGDLSPRNILCRTAGERLEFFWLDNEGTRRFGRLPERLRVRNLVQVDKRLLPLSRTDRMRLARGYFERVSLPRAARKALLRRVAAARAAVERGRGLTPPPPGRIPPASAPGTPSR
jgi:hypothetical protein